MRVAVLDYGIGNLRSPEKALQHVGAVAHLCRDAASVGAADAVVLPGVGNFGACVEALVASGLDGVARAAVENGRPFLGVCVGMQMLYEASTESPDVPGLGLLPGTVDLLPAEVKRPQMQWNLLTTRQRSHPMFSGIDDPWVYFVHSYVAPLSDATIATCDYGGPQTAAVSDGHLWATQFHPEKSGPVGLAVLANFVRWAEGATS